MPGGSAVTRLGNWSTGLMDPISNISALLNLFSLYTKQGVSQTLFAFSLPSSFSSPLYYPPPCSPFFCFSSLFILSMFPSPPLPLSRASSNTKGSKERLVGSWGCLETYEGMREDVTWRRLKYSSFFHFFYSLPQPQYVFYTSITFPLPPITTGPE